MWDLIGCSSHGDGVMFICRMWQSRRTPQARMAWSIAYTAQYPVQQYLVTVVFPCTTFLSSSTMVSLVFRCDICCTKSLLDLLFYFWCIHLHGLKECTCVYIVAFVFNFYSNSMCFKRPLALNFLWTLVHSNRSKGHVNWTLFTFLFQWSLFTDPSTKFTVNKFVCKLA